MGIAEWIIVASFVVSAIAVMMAQAFAMSRTADALEQIYGIMYRESSDYRRGLEYRQ